MAGDPLKKIQPGDRLEIAAEAYNAFVDVVRRVRSQQTIGADPQEFLRDTTLAKVRNLTGAARARFSVVGLDQHVPLALRVGALHGEDAGRRPPLGGGVPFGAAGGGRLGRGHRRTW